MGASEPIANDMGRIIRPLLQVGEHEGGICLSEFAFCYLAFIRERGSFRYQSVATNRHHLERGRLTSDCARAEMNFS